MKLMCDKFIPVVNNATKHEAALNQVFNPCIQVKKMREEVLEGLIGKETAFESVQGTSIQAVLKRENLTDKAAGRVGVTANPRETQWAG